MTFTTGTLSRCSGQNHFQIDITVNGVTRTLRVGREEFEGDPPPDLEQAREAVLTRLRSAAKEANAGTFAQIKTALDNKTFKV